MHIDILPVTEHDLPNIGLLQPPDWPPIVPEFDYYIRAEFCYPVKAVIDNEISGLGTCLLYGSTAWLAHIITLPIFRNRGIGSAVVNHLLQIANRHQLRTTLLIATDLGKPVYVKYGFRAVAEYAFFRRHIPFMELPVSDNIKPYNEDMFGELMSLDKLISGEDRTFLLQDFTKEAWVFVDDGKITGFYLPLLKEGPILAKDRMAGIELMKFKYRNADKAVIPSGNKTGIDFLLANGFKRTENRATRMLVGTDIPWIPECIYSRAGGNFG